MAVDTGDIETIDAPLDQTEETLVMLLDEPVTARAQQEDAIVKPESTEPAPDSEYFTAPLLDENDNEMGR